MSAYDFLSRLLISDYEVDPSAVQPSSTLADLGLDSLSTIEVMLDLEDEFGIDIVEERERLGTLGDVVALIDHHSKGTSAE